MRELDDIALEGDDVERTNKLPTVSEMSNESH